MKIKLTHGHHVIKAKDGTRTVLGVGDTLEVTAEEYKDQFSNRAESLDDDPAPAPAPKPPVPVIPTPTPVLTARDWGNPFSDMSATELAEELLKRHGVAKAPSFGKARLLDLLTSIEGTPIQDQHPAMRWPAAKLREYLAAYEVALTGEETDADLLALAQVKDMES